jgi:hypothetical protein
MLMWPLGCQLGQTGEQCQAQIYNQMINWGLAIPSRNLIQDLTGVEVCRWGTGLSRTVGGEQSQTQRNIGMNTLLVTLAGGEEWKRRVAINLARMFVPRIKVVKCKTFLPKKILSCSAHHTWRHNKT